MSRRVAPLLVCLLWSCSGSPDSMGMRLESLDYTLAPGEERYFCYARTIPAAEGETAITAYRPDYGAGTHHIFFGYTLDPEPEGFSECPVLSRDTWVPLYLGGVESSDLVLPAGAAVRLPPGTQIFMQLHLQNPTTAPITARTAMELDLAVPSPDLVPAGVFGLDDRTVFLPARASAVETSMSCLPGRHMDVFAVLGHMHTMGRELDVFRGDVGGELLYHEQWDFAEQPTSPVSFTIEAGDMVSLRCRHDNPTDTDVPYGESSLTEMCAFVFYYTPFDAVDGCIETGTR